MTRTNLEALVRTITSRRPDLASEAAKLLHPRAAVDLRVQGLVPRALERGEWTDEERALLTEALIEATGGERVERRDVQVLLLVTPAQAAAYTAAAEAAGISRAEWIRRACDAAE